MHYRYVCKNILTRGEFIMQAKCTSTAARRIFVDSIFRYTTLTSSHKFKAHEITAVFVLMRVLKFLQI